MTLLTIPALDPVWSPLSQQVAEPDTTFLLDPDADTAAGMAIMGGNTALGAFVEVATAAAPTVVAGKFRKGILANTSISGSVFAPVDGILPPAEWTIEFWCQSTADWFAMSNLALLAFGASDFVEFQVLSTHQITANLSHTQNAASLTSYSKVASATAFSSGTYPANTWVHLAATLKSGTLTLYVNGVSAASTSSVVAPTVWSCAARGDGLTVPGFAGRAAVGCTLSDLRVSRFARVPSVSTVAVKDRSTVTVSASTSGTVQKLNGIVKPIAPGSLPSFPAAYAPSASAAAVCKAQAGVSVARLDGFLSVTPIKSGGTDATHPNLGHSGSFSYDWRVVDREVNWVLTTMGVPEIYVSLDATPQLLGGGNAPYSDTTMTTSASAQTPDVSGTLVLTATPAVTNGEFTYSGNRYKYTNTTGSTLLGVTFISGTPGLSIPGGSTVHLGFLTGAYAYTVSQAVGPITAGNNAAFATMCADLLYHMVNDLGAVVNYAGLWNEPDLTWGVGTIADYCATYQAVVTTVKAALPSIKLGGPEISAWSGSTTTWISQFITFCAANSVALDFISFHWYSGDFTQLINAQLQIQAWCTAASISMPPLIVGEYGWQAAWTGFDPGNGKYPFCQPNGSAYPGITVPSPQPYPVDFATNDWAAAWRAVAMILMQTHGIVLATHFTGADNSLFDANAVPQAIYNVLRMWGLTIGNQGLVSTITSDPGVYAYASKNTGTGKVYVLLASLHYRKTTTYPVLVDVSAVASNGTAVTAYLIDDQHSNAYDAGNGNAVLQTVSTTVGVSGANVVSGGKVGMNLRPRAAALLVIG